ncbi:MAG: GAF domain-containing protein [Leptolyngbyaceae cyanobacterium CSU_1_4]|nr:GAF domain-containing protein [Leptolyngbyaceae cyanobacterium CSU_1_4]
MDHFSSSPSEQDMLTPLPYSATDLVTPLTLLLSSVCDRTEWEYGESWIPDATRPILELSPAWCVTTYLNMNQAIPWMQFQVCSKSFVLRPGEGLPGRVWRSQQPEWLENVSAQSETYFLRNQIAKALSVKAGLGIPILLNSQVLAVIVFFMSKERSPDAKLMEQTQAIVANFQHDYLAQDS